MLASSSEERPSVSRASSFSSSAPFSLSAADRRLLLLSPATVISQRTPSHLSRPEIVEFFSRFGSLCGPGDGLAFPSDRRDKRLLIRFQRLQDAVRCLKAQGVSLERRGDEEHDGEAKTSERRIDDSGALSSLAAGASWGQPLQLSREDKIKLSALRGNARAMQLLHKEGTLKRLREREKNKETPGQPGDSQQPGARPQLFPEEAEGLPSGDRERERHPAHRVSDDAGPEDREERDWFFTSRSAAAERSTQREEAAGRQRPASGADPATSQREGRPNDSPLIDLLSGALIADQLKQTESGRAGWLGADLRRPALGEAGVPFAFHERAFGWADEPSRGTEQTLRGGDGEDGFEEADEDAKAARRAAETAFIRRRAEATHSWMISSLAGFVFNPENPYDNFLIPALPRPAPAVSCQTPPAVPPM
ncbi:conserved hypothetical protein [Neospora caninum Liverpool]|uniref:Uncharacterized protein n=1 Tax=Neospora caninum (strain Liverpool) TaxID=572307 RepID=F0VDI8_NEOCL|nr:conserved hypothetical protein [Neospora caninum Liverpool]CBZ51781.1 conserved hypothetical protein [Neospora caninum Liverpool]CEL65738.1 TPA: hypothetical protein BN1204_015730 [Neospora caninum Liverpool]|eukprot:XP_003881814.1 conserved hypothetical protein [Neospora caninum Liverpool]